MKRIALALAAAALGTGCIVTTDGTNGCPDTTLTIDWSFTDADGYSRSCAQMGIVGIDLYYDGIQVHYDDYNHSLLFPCANGYQTLTLPIPGQHAILIEGVDAYGYVVARSNEWATVASCGDSYHSANATEGYVRIDYSIAPDNVCGGGYMWFAIRDDVAGYTAALIDQTSTSALKTAYACPAEIRFPLAAGDYTLQWIEEVASPLSTPTALHEQCGDVLFTIGGPGTQPVPVTLVTATTGCPPQ